MRRAAAVRRAGWAGPAHLSGRVAQPGSQESPSPVRYGAGP
ncbi:Hypothetical protein SCLAV_3484 [Streptomyces clavuligerus]|uniref:Uncharacterized protein n=1 Tax=Streptomyces clavuligerus TaxID=1901 RepID=E2Q151_STRCL|nr:Hypothetical protein SCLAV_3484 [Streptomyces clavuligerus]